MQHKGEIVEKYVRQSGISITRLSRQVKKSRRWVYQLFANPNAPLDYILEIGKVIHHDFSEDIDELRRYRQSRQPMVAVDPNYSLKDDDYWKNKYLDLLEEYNSLLIRHNRLLARKH